MHETTRQAFAKINLALAVDKPREEGMHPIATWMTAIDLADDVAVIAHDRPPDRPWSCEWAEDAPVPPGARAPIDWPAEKDLALRAARALERRTGETFHAEIRIAKRIPAGAGLGGGSSNAAAALLALNELYELDLPIEELQAVGHGLGSDVPFFLDEADPPRPALVTELGESIERTPPVDAHLALVIPDFPCPTGAVYRAFDELEHEGFREPEIAAMARAGGVDPERLFNDLSPAAERVEFVLASIRSRAEQIAGTAVHVTGSGSAMFAIGENEGDARARAAAVEAELTGCSVLATRTLP